MDCANSKALHLMSLHFFLMNIVKINTVITDLLGSKTKLCSVTPIVLPTIKTNEEL